MDAIVLTDVCEYHFEERGTNVITKSQLLALGEKHEREIALNRKADAPYR